MLVLLCWINTIHELAAQTLPEIPVIQASKLQAPPEWAVLQRKVIAAMETSGDFYWERFMQDGATTIGDGPYDDLYEMFYNWPEFYALGGDERFFQRALAAYNGITRTNTPYPPDSGDYFNRLYKEFPTHDDFFHISEGMTLFYNLALGNPRIHENIVRAKRFAGFYLNEDPEAPNYDPELGIVQSIFTGSKGPLSSSDAEYNLRYGHASLYPVLDTLEPHWHEDPERKEEIQQLYNKVVTRTDVPVNMGITGLMTHAYLYTGEDKYKDWVIHYVDNWMNHIQQNDGILPDNIGLNGEIGAYREGQWWGGLYGWYGRYGVSMMYASMSVAMETALMLSGDEQYLNLLRSQLRLLLDQAMTLPSGQQLVPYRHNKQGWHSYRPMMIRDWAHLYHASMDSADWKSIDQMRKGHKYRPLNMEGIWGQNMLDHLDTMQYTPIDTFDWAVEMAMGDRTMGKSEYARWMYYAGNNPDWPVQALQADYQEMINRMEFMRNDPRPIEAIEKDDTYPNNPVLTKVLSQMIQGSPQTIYFGGLSRATLRYFDAKILKPGLPNQVAALVTHLSDDTVEVDLVNLHPIDTQEVIIQAGAFAEHQFTGCRYDQYTYQNTSASDVTHPTRSFENTYVKLTLPPSASITLALGINRFSQNPTYAFPWHEQKYIPNPRD